MRAARIWLLAIALVPALARAGEVSVAVASNFTAPMRQLAAAFEAQTGHKARLAFGATGTFYAQVRGGAPFEVLLAADDETPAKLEREGLAVAGTRFTYAVGQLVLWSARPGAIDDKGEVLRTGTFDRIAIANPKLAPYGAAAVETLRRLGVHERLQARIVQGETIAQTYQFVATGNAAVGFVALSQVAEAGRIAKGSGWIVPASLHDPIRQDAVLLTRGRDSEAARALLAFLRSDPARALIRAYGYTV